MDNQPPADNDPGVSLPSPPEVGKSDPVNPTDAEPATAAQLTKVEEKMSGFERASLRWNKAASLLSLFVAIFVFGQWYEIRQTLRISERPYVTVENARFEPPLEQSYSPATLMFDFHNTGRTPALQGTYEVEGLIDGEKGGQNPSPFPAEVAIPSDRVITVVMKMTFSKSGMLEGVEDGTKPITIKGSVKYLDIFKEWHRTQFCMVYDGQDKVWAFCPGTDVE